MDLNVVCVKWGTKFSHEYVNRLHSAVQRNLPVPHRFVCFTDDDRWIDNNIETMPIPRDDLKSCWNKLALFSDTLKLTGVMLYLDLDNLITGPLEPLFRYREEERYMGLVDWGRPYTFASGIFRMHVGTFPQVLDYFDSGLQEGWLKELEEGGGVGGAEVELRRSIRRSRSLTLPYWSQVLGQQRSRRVGRH